MGFNVIAFESGLYVEANERELKEVYSKLKTLLEENMQELVSRYSSNNLLPLFAHQTSVSMLSYIDFWLDEENEMAIRDRAMADNVRFLKDLIYPDEKIMIWAHNFHIRHHNDRIDQEGRDQIKSMGTWLHEKYADELYTIGLYMYRGQASYVNREVYTVESHAPNSMEAILYSTGYPYSFLDMRQAKNKPSNDWMSTKVVTKTWGLEDLSLIPRDQYDAILFIDSVSPPVYLQ